MLNRNNIEQKEFNDQKDFINGKMNRLSMNTDYLLTMLEGISDGNPIKLSFKYMNLGSKYIPMILKLVESYPSI